MRLSDHDASFLYTETAAGPMHGVGIQVLEGNISYEEYVDYINARIHLVPRLRQRLVFVPGNIAHPKWVDDPYFDIHNHIKRFEIPEDTAEEDIINVALQLGEKLLPRDRSLWLTYVIESLPDVTIIVQMQHHAMVDGASGVEIATIMADFTEEVPEIPPPESEWQPAPLQTPAQLWQEALRDNQRAQFEQFFPAPQHRPNPLQVAKGQAIVARMMSRPVMTCPWNASIVGPKRVVGQIFYELDDFRGIKNALGGKINDVVLACASEAAARYMQERGEWLAGQYMRIMVPVDVREEGDTAPGNQVSAFYPVLPAWPMPAAQRYAAVRQEMDTLKANDEAKALHALMQSQTSASLPPTAMASTLLVGTPWDPTAFGAQVQPPVLPHFGFRPPLYGFNFTCSNVPGVNGQQYVAGNPIVGGAGTIMLSGTLGLGIVASSGNGFMGFGLTADPRLVADLDRLTRLIGEVFTELGDLAGIEVHEQVAETDAAATADQHSEAELATEA